jgi:hypothetical protein
MCNEVYFSGNQEKVKRLLSRMVALTHELDPTRPAAIGGCQRGGLDHLGDIAGYNGDGARLFINPGIPSVVTEYSSVRAVRPGNYAAAWGNLVQGPGDKSQPFFWRYPWRSGESLWCAFDHGSIAGDEGKTGIIDYFRLPKRQWYWYRNEYLHIPPPAWPVLGTPAKLQLTADKTIIHGTDAMDDAQVVVTVLGADGKPISNSPEVTLTIESGPGEFPTGPSIAFSPDSDIAIRDGQAAIELRSYYGGTTVIRAHATDLEDATLSIMTEGLPRFTPGQTCSVPARPYVRFTNARQGATLLSLGKDAPTRAASEAPDHPGRFANDGDDNTFWSAASDGAGAWWEVDLERLCYIKGLKITFPNAGTYRYKVENSDDGQQWHLADDESETTSTDQMRVDNCMPGSEGRYLRLTFTGVPPNSPAKISEVQIFGSVRP